MGLPRNPHTAGRKDAPDHTAIEDDHGDRAKDGTKAAFDRAQRYKKAEPAKDQATGPDDDTRSSHDPDRQARDDHDGDTCPPEPFRRNSDADAAQDDQRDRIGSGVFYASMQKWHGRDTDKAGDAAWLEPEPQVQSVTQRQVNNFYDPDQYDQDQDRPDRLEQCLARHAKAHAKRFGPGQVASRPKVVVNRLANAEFVALISCDNGYARNRGPIRPV